jgi:hypothetical protein
VGVVIVAVVLLDGPAERPAPGLHGDRLGVLLALVAFAVGLLGAREAVLRHAPLWVQVPLLFALVAGSGVLMWLQPGGPGFLGFFFLAAWVAALRVPAPAGATAAGLALVLALAMVRAATAHRPVMGIVLSALGLSVLYLVVVLAQRAREGQRRAERLLEELEHSRASDPPDTGRLVTALDRAHQLAQAGLRDARRAIGALRDDELPGPQRLAGLAREFERDSGVGCRLEVTGAPRELGSQARLAVYRTAQEALTNVRKHAHPERVELRLGYERDGTRLTVEDHTPDGVHPAAAGDGYGITGMRERAELLGGTLTAGPTGTGFRVELWVPA